MVKHDPHTRRNVFENEKMGLATLTPCFLEQALRASAVITSYCARLKDVPPHGSSASVRACRHPRFVELPLPMNLLQCAAHDLTHPRSFSAGLVPVGYFITLGMRRLHVPNGRPPPFRQRGCTSSSSLHRPTDEPRPALSA